MHNIRNQQFPTLWNAHHDKYWEVRGFFNLKRFFLSPAFLQRPLLPLLKLKSDAEWPVCSPKFLCGISGLWGSYLCRGVLPKMISNRSKALKFSVATSQHHSRCDWIPTGEILKQRVGGNPGWRSLVPAFGPGRNPGDLGSNPTSGSRCMEPASPSTYVSASLSLSLCDYHK